MSGKKKKDAFDELPDAPAPAPKKGKDAFEDLPSYTENFEKQAQLDRGVGPAVVEAAPDLALLGAQGATLGFMDEGAGAIEALQGGDYTKGRDEARDSIQAARDRRGLLGDVAETAGSMVTSVAVPSLRGGTFIKELGVAALQGAGEAPEMKDVPSQAGKSALVSAGSQAVVKGAANKMFGQPDEILARTAGARGINFRDGTSDMKDPAEVAKRLDSIGFFKMGDRVFDPSSKTFVLNSVPQNGKLEGFLKPQSLDTLLERAEKSTMLLGQQNAQLLKGKKIPVRDVDDVLVDTAFDFIPDGADVASRANAATDLVTEIVRDLRARGAIKNGFIDASEVQKVKQYLQQKVQKSYKNQAMSDITNEGVEARRMYATKLDKLLDQYGGKEYAKNNDLMHDIFLQKEMIHNKASRQKGYGVESPALTRPKWTDKIQDAFDTPMVGVGRARMGQALETPAGAASMDALNRLPVEVINNRQQNSGRSPQSANLPEQLIRTPLPRTTTGLMENKNFVLSKIAQMAPDMLEAVKDTYENDPEMLGQLAPIIAQKMPHFFERDKYNRFDGRIMNEADKQKAIKDTLGDSRLSTIEQAKIITRLNKEGLYDR